MAGEAFGTGGAMTWRRKSGPKRLQRRLTATFIVVAAISAGIVAVVTILLAREYRWRALRDDAESETRLALALGPNELGTASFDRFLELYQRRSDAHVIAVQDGRMLSSSDELTADDIPEQLDEIDADPMLVEADTNGDPMLVSGAVGRDGVDFYLFFSLRQYRESLAELIRAAAFAWLGTVAVAGGLGWVIARRTLRPVRIVAAAADAIAAGNLQARLDADADDELGVLSRSFNNMADEVERLIDRLESSAARERQFSADVAHELRTPLTGMSAAAAVLDAQREELPRSTREPAEILINDVARLKQLVVELLELAALEAPEASSSFATLDLGLAITAVIADAQQRRRAEIGIDVDAGLAVRADPFALRRILGNLIDNAMKHGGGRASICGRIDDADSGQIRVDVIDHGPGIAPEELDRIFERFHKTDRSRATGGTGLGLAIARRYARLQLGHLTASNEPDGGARFTLVLPRAPLHTDDHRKADVTGAPDPSRSAGQGASDGLTGRSRNESVTIRLMP